MAGETLITIVGNLCADPELRFTQSGAAVVGFTVASTPRVLDKATDKWVDGDALFMRCTAWRQLAENITECLPKGTRVVVTGRLEQRSYETKEGEKRTVMEMQVDEIGPSLKWTMVKVVRPDREGGGQQSRPQQQRQAPAADPWGSAPVRGGGFDSEPPFHHSRALDTYNG